MSCEGPNAIPGPICALRWLLRPPGTQDYDDPYNDPYLNPFGYESDSPSVDDAPRDAGVRLAEEAIEPRPSYQRYLESQRGRQAGLGFLAEYVATQWVGTRLRRLYCYFVEHCRGW